MTALLLAALLTAAPAKHAYTVQDQVTLKRVMGFKVSPDGTRVVFQQRVTDLDANRGRMDLWLVNTDGTGLKQLTTHPENDTDPQFSPDGKSILFLSSRGGSNQIWSISLTGGEPRQVTTSPVDIDSFNVSRDGNHLVFAADTFPDCDSLECTAKKLAEKSKNKSSGRVYDSLMFRHWDSWGDGRRAHLFVQKLEGGTPVDVIKGMNADAPSKPFGGSEEYTFSPDGKSIVFTARDSGKSEAWSTDMDLFQVPVEGNKAPTKLTVSNRATDTAPGFSHDGKSLAYLAMERPKYEADKLHLVIRNWADGKERSLAQDWDRSIDSMVWSADDKTLFVTVQDVGQKAVFAVDVSSGKQTKLIAEGHVTQAEISSTGLVYAMDSLKAPSELFACGFDGKNAKALTAVNAEALASIKLGEPEQFSFKGAKDDTVYAYVVKPVDFDAKKKYPLAFLIHGGPQGSFGNDWHYRWNPQSYAAHGYVAVMVDFHGSTGYGQGFTDAIRGDWGGKPLEDLQKGLAAALAKYSFIDKDRMCALGASYGGYMVNYIAGNWNQPWKCLVSHDGNLDEQMAYFDTEELWFPEWEHEGTPWENPASYQKHNPINKVSEWKVPMLIVHSGKDYRVVDTQGMSSFTALQRKGIPSKFLYFPDENHWVLKPANSILWHDTVFAWLDQWTKK